MNWWTKSKEFLSEVRSEMRKVSFPTRDEVVATTIVVVITSFVFAAFLFVADQLIIYGYQGIVTVFK
jgi:preprotein translocase subunit SecE